MDVAGYEKYVEEALRLTRGAIRFRIALTIVTVSLGIGLIVFALASGGSFNEINANTLFALGGTCISAFGTLASNDLWGKFRRKSALIYLLGRLQSFDGRRTDSSDFEETKQLVHKVLEASLGV